MSTTPEYTPENFTPGKRPEVAQEQPKTVDLEAGISALEAALTTDVNTATALVQVAEAYDKLENVQRTTLVQKIAARCMLQPHMIQKMEFWTTLARGKSEFFIALLRHLETMCTASPEHSPLLARVRIMKGGYLARQLTPEYECEINAAFTGASQYLESADNPSEERLLASQQYEQHRVPFAQAKPYLDAVVNVAPGDTHTIATLQRKYLTEVTALKEAIRLLEQSEATDRKYGHVMYANQTRNRILALEKEGKLRPLSELRAAFEELDRNYETVDPATLRVGTKQDLSRFRKNTVGRIGEVCTELGDDASAEKAKKQEVEFARQME